VLVVNFLQVQELEISKRSNSNFGELSKNVIENISST